MQTFITYPRVVRNWPRLQKRSLRITHTID